MRRRRDETGIRAEVRQAAAELRRVSRALLKLWWTDDPTLAADGHRLLRLIAHGMGLQAGWLAEELKIALEGQRRGETLPPPPLARIVLTVPREQAVPWTICSGRSGRPVGEWLAGLADAEVERLSELADREELSKWLLELGAEGQPAPQEHGPEQRASFRRAAELLGSRAAAHHT
jgi:hypothetical protein